MKCEWCGDRRPAVESIKVGSKNVGDTTVGVYVCDQTCETLYASVARMSESPRKRFVGQAKRDYDGPGDRFKS